MDSRLKKAMEAEAARHTAERLASIDARLARIEAALAGLADRITRAAPAAPGPRGK